VAKVTTQFTSDDKELQASIDARLDNLHEKNKKLSEQSARGGSTANNVLKMGVSELANMAMGMVSVSALVGHLTAGFNQWKQEVEAIGTASREMQKSLLATLAASNDLRKGGVVEKWLESNPGGAVATREDRLAAFGAISREEAQLPLEKKTELADQVARLKPTGANVQETGANAASFQDMMPNLAPEGVVDVTMKARQLAGNRSGMFADDSFQRSVQAFQRHGFGDEYEAVATMMTAAEADLPMKRVESAMTEQKKKGKKEFTLLPGMDKDRVSELASSLRVADQEDFASQGLTALEGFRAGKQSKHDTEEDVKRDNSPAVRIEEAREKYFTDIYEMRLRQTAGNPIQRLGLIGDASSGRVRQYLGGDGAANMITGALQTGGKEEDRRELMQRHAEFIAELKEINSTLKAVQGNQRGAGRTTNDEAR
jgi:hypothetical protein